MSLLEQETTRKGRINEFVEVPKSDTGNDKEYKVETIWNGAVYVKKIDGHLSGIYYLVA